MDGDVTGVEAMPLLRRPRNRYTMCVCRWNSQRVDIQVIFVDILRDIIETRRCDGYCAMFCRMRCIFDTIVSSSIQYSLEVSEE